MLKLKPVSYKDFVRKLRKFGFGGPYSGGKHLYMIRGGIKLTIPNPHKRKEIGVDLLLRILKQAEITREKWIEEE